MRLRKSFIIVPFFLLGCVGGEDYERRKVEKVTCEQTALKKYPKKIVTEKYIHKSLRNVSVPTGSQICRQIPNGSFFTMECKPRMSVSTVVVKEERERKKDKNLKNRRDYIKACVVQSCNKKYGNSECKSN